MGAKSLRKTLLLMCALGMCAGWPAAAAYGQDDGFGGDCPPGPPPFEDDGGRGAKMHEKMMADLHRDIGLSPEQDDKLRAMREKDMENVRGLHRQLRYKQEQMRLELDKYKSDMDKVNALIVDINAAHDALVKNRVEAITQLKQVLTQEQFELLVQKMRIRMEVMRELHHRKGGPFPGRDTDERQPAAGDVAKTDGDKAGEGAE